jgi:hypothetical protein
MPELTSFLKTDPGEYTQQIQSGNLEAEILRNSQLALFVSASCHNGQHLRAPGSRHDIANGIGIQLLCEALVRPGRWNAPAANRTIGHVQQNSPNPAGMRMRYGLVFQLTRKAISRRPFQIWLFYSIKLESQEFSNCGFRNDESIINSPRENCVNRASIANSQFLQIPDANPSNNSAKISLDRPDNGHSDRLRGQGR